MSTKANFTTFLRSRYIALVIIAGLVSYSSTSLLQGLTCVIMDHALRSTPEYKYRMTGNCVVNSSDKTEVGLTMILLTVQLIVYVSIAYVVYKCATDED